MAERSSHGGNSAVLLSAMAGAVLGAAGLTWWLLSEADRRRQSGARRHARPTAAATSNGYMVADAPAPRPLPERALHDKVHELNQAIDEVRRQLESLSTSR
ncbi:MAG: hypothetical protein ACKO7Z_08145 [Cyanobacteriota bacterium]